MKLFQKTKFFFLDSGGRAVSHTHTGPKVVLTAFESFRNENLRILPVFTKLKLKAYRRSYSEKRGMPPLSLCLIELGGTCSGRWTHTWTLESSSFSLM
jgi:hypothetical protein